MSHIIATDQLLTCRQVKALFPDCQVIVERMLGILSQSYIIVRMEEQKQL
ncbi:hypothetical protein Q2T42_07285 [Leptolyngbya boryana CZ1]|uniref:Uncharacterized protein n=1 Tax=Leptolyngbya boryana CZ1 TaxID=3060204 RepID=A0AA97AQG1_LEPBY|nr:hypothetical protein [Leptolyngbya boryana]WNZ47633.1 hypothetical protein Q2T42_07285 [Leptolyngbya boryana CZ1]